jgi:4-oxalocrotonate tautomerase
MTARAVGPIIEGAPEPGGRLTRRFVMPLINVKLIEGVFDAGQKQEIVRRLTDTMVSIEGEAMRPVTWVVVEEVASGEWGIGGQPMTTADVKALQGAPA